MFLVTLINSWTDSLTDCCFTIAIHIAMYYIIHKHITILIIDMIHYMIIVNM